MNAAQIIDLNQCDRKDLSERASVCVIGAGAAGIYLAVSLASKGLDVVVLEAGGLATADGTKLVGMDTDFPADAYPAATAGRYFGVGGTTAHWGGLLVPHCSHDLRPVSDAFDAWRHIVAVVTRYRAAVLKRLGWYNGDGFAVLLPCHGASETLRPLGLSIKSGLMMPPRKKNFTRMLHQTHFDGGGLKVFCNAIVTGFDSTEGEASRLRTAKAVSHKGSRLQVSASYFIVAAGAIESARILLELNESCFGSTGGLSSATGCFLGDHLSVPIAEVSAGTRRDAFTLFGPRFEQGWMRIFRFLESNPPPDAPRAFGHFIFDTESPGFLVVKEVLRALQSGRRPRMSARQMIAGSADVALLGFYRYAQSRLYVRPDTKVLLQLDIEQVPLRGNAIKMGNRRDPFGRRTVEIHWRISEQDTQNIQQTAERFLSKWPGRRHSLPELASLHESWGGIKPYDAYHPVGTCRLGRDREAVVDENLKVSGLQNLWVVSTGVLPSAGTANPTFTMLCLAQGLVDKLAEAARKHASGN